MSADLARRAVACKGWRWLSGMAWVVRRAAPLDDIRGRVISGSGEAPYPGALPVLSDPATLGCLLALVREAWDDSELCTGWEAVSDGHGRWVTWLVAFLGGREPVAGDSEAEALVAALECAP